MRRETKEERRKREESERLVRHLTREVELLTENLKDEQKYANSLLAAVKNLRNILGSAKTVLEDATDKGGIKASLFYDIDCSLCGSVEALVSPTLCSSVDCLCVQHRFFIQPRICFNLVCQVYNSPKSSPLPHSPDRAALDASCIQLIDRMLSKD